jgi:hypothetical protein
VTRPNELWETWPQYLFKTWKAYKDSIGWYQIYDAHDEADREKFDEFEKMREAR